MEIICQTACSHISENCSLKLGAHYTSAIIGVIQYNFICCLHVYRTEPFPLCLSVSLSEEHKTEMYGNNAVIYTFFCQVAFRDKCDIHKQNSCQKRKTWFCTLRLVMTSWALALRQVKMDVTEVQVGICHPINLFI
jgi:hypothetical protein